MDKQTIVCKDREGKEFKIDKEKLFFRPSVYGIIIDQTKILLSKQWDGYDLPGGGVELGETIKEALVREIKEETGLDAEMDELIACQDSFFKASKEHFFHSVLLFYTAKIKGGTISTEFFDKTEIGILKEAEWVDLDKIENLKFYSSVDLSNIIKQAINLNRKANN